MTQPVPAGWYPDPTNPAQQRYWDGAAWTEHCAPMAPPQPAAQQPSTSVQATTAIGASAKGAVESALNFVEGQQKRREDKKRQEQEAAEAAAEKARVQREKTLAFMRRYWKPLLAALVALVLIIAVGAWNDARHQAAASTAAMPESAADLKGDDYQDVKARLESAGFTSVETTAIPDLIVGWITKDGEVEVVSVNGRTDYSSGSEFPKDAKVVIKYHTFPEEEPEPATENSVVESEAPEPAAAVAVEVSDEILTARNNKELAAVLKAENPGDPEVQAFIRKYAGRTIEFDGYTWDWVNHTSTSPFSGEVTTYDTRFDTNICVGNVKTADTISMGPLFHVEDFSMPNYSPSVNRQNVRVKATVDGYDAERAFFNISVISLEDR